MERELNEEWYVLQDRAIAAVREGASGCKQGLRVAQFIVLPSFAVNESLEIARPPGRASSYHVVRVAWRADLDGAKFRDPLERLRHSRQLQPTLEIATRPIADGRVVALCAELGGHTVPLSLGESAVGCDGTFYQLRLGGGFAEMTAQWWCEPPRGWECAANAFHRIRRELAEMFNQT